MSELITVIVPIYKVENYLVRCVDSLINQTYKNLEIILINDGSPDNCGVICDEYMLLDRRIKVIHQKNAGLSAARNSGIKIATGEYITFIDSDDWVHIEYVEKLYNLIKNSGAEISVCNFVRTSTEKVLEVEAKKKVYQFSKTEALEQLYGDFYVQLVTAWGKLYKKNLFDNILFPVGKIHEDEFTTHKVIFEAENIILTSEVLLYYWQREDSITGNEFNLKNYSDSLEALDERADFFEKNDLLELNNKASRYLFIVYVYNKKLMDTSTDNRTKIKIERRFRVSLNKMIKNERRFALKTLYLGYKIFPGLFHFGYRVYMKIIPKTSMI